VDAPARAHVQDAPAHVPEAAADRESAGFVFFNKMFKDYLKILLILVILFIGLAFGYFFYWKASVQKASSLYKSGKWDEAEKKMIHNIEVFPGFLFGRETEYMRLGEIYYQRGDIQKSEQYFLQTLNIDREIALPLFRLGIIRDGEGRHSEAIDYYEKALRAKMDDPKTVLQIQERLAAVLYRYGLQHQMYSDWDTALRCYMRLLEIYPDFPEALHAIGTIYMQQKKYKEAWAYFSKALEMNPDLTILYEDSPDLLIKLGRPKDAKRYKDKYDSLMKEIVSLGEEEVLKENSN
jgi:tetratricopeptide (TPR) repeat protein